jgi:tetratricopeptide (TPR) repeat protein
MIRKEKDEATRLVPALADSVKRNATDKKRLANGTSIFTALLRRHPSLADSIVAEIGSTLRSSSRKTGDNNNLLVLADFLGNSGDLKGTLDLCEQLFKDVNPRQVVAIAVNAAGSNKAEKEQFDRVEALIKSAQEKEKEPKLFTEWELHLAIIKERRGDYLAAEALYRGILVREPANEIVMNNLAFMLGLRGKSAEANELIQALITKTGPLAELLDTRAVIQLGQGKHADAEKDIRAALDNARTPYRLFHLAHILRSTGKTGDAVKVFLEAERLGLHKEKMLHPLEIPQYEALKKLTT